MISIHLCAFIAMCVTTLASSNSTTSKPCERGKVCRCENISYDQSEANQLSLRCSISNLEDLDNLIKDPDKVHTLDLSSNGLKDITPGSFQKYINLVNLNLTKNPLRTINVKPANEELGKLQYLNVRGSFWIPTAEVLSLSALREIEGVRFNQACSHCSLIKTNSSTEFSLSELKKGVFIRGNKGNCRGMKYQVDNLTSIFSTYGFIPSCLSKSVNEKCYVSQITEIPFHRCFETDNKIFNLLFVFGIIGLFLNASVVLITMTEAKLRKRVVMLMVSSLAVGDFLVQIYSVSLVSARKRTYNEFLLISEKFCNFAGFIWTTGMFITITTSVLLTVERYLTIVYSFRPGIHIHIKCALSLISVSWLVALTISILPYMGIGTYTGNTLCVPVVPTSATNRPTNPTYARFGIGLAMVAIVLYLSMIPFYVLIFMYVKKSGSGIIGIKREGTVALRIAILVGSNMIFFFLPVIIATLYITTDITKGMTPVAKEALTGGLGTICTSVNSFLNPLLYAYRNDRFRRVLCRRLAIARTRNHSKLSSRSK